MGKRYQSNKDGDKRHEDQSLDKPEHELKICTEPPPSHRNSLTEKGESEILSKQIQEDIKMHTYPKKNSNLQSPIRVASSTYGADGKKNLFTTLHPSCFASESYMPLQ